MDYLGGAGKRCFEVNTVLPVLYETRFAGNAIHAITFATGST